MLGSTVGTKDMRINKAFLVTSDKVWEREYMYVYMYAPMYAYVCMHVYYSQYVVH